MPTYDYFCPENGRSVEVLHSMSVVLATWGEVCERAEVDPGDTPLDTSVTKCLSAGLVLSGESRRDGPAEMAPPMCGRCGGMPGSCRMHDH